MHRVHGLKRRAVHDHHAWPIGEQVDPASEGFGHMQPRPAERLGQPRGGGVFVHVIGAEPRDDDFRNTSLLQCGDIFSAQHPALAQPPFG